MKVLVALPRFPYPLEKGDKLRAYHQIRCLSKNNDVVLFCVSHQEVSDEHIEKIKPYCSAIKVVTPSKIKVYYNILKAFLSINSLQVNGYWNTKKIRNEYSAFEKEQNPDVVYCQMVRTMEWVKKSSKPKLLDFQDCLSKNVERRMYKTKGLLRRILHYEFKMLRSCEYDAFECYDAFTIISSADREAIPHQKNDIISILPNGVDTALFRPRNIAVEYDILFSGNMHYAPNIDAAVFLIKDIMPIVWQKRPHTTVMLAGADPVPTVKRLQSDKVTVTGWVNDIGECYAKAGLFVAPMRIGTGLQNKLLEAMATKKPCITSPLANNALAAEDGKQVIVAKTAQEYADAIIEILDNKEKADMLADNAYNYVLQKYSWDKYNELLETLLNDMYNKCNCKQ